MCCIGLASALALCGCIPDQETLAPDIATPARFDAAGGGAAPAPRDWLATFGSAELTRLGAAAAAQNLDVKAAVARIEQADAQARVAAAALYPTLSGNAGAAQTFTPGVARVIDPPFRPSRATLYGLTFSAAYQVDFWGRYRDGAESALLTAEGARFDSAVVALSTQAALANLYVQLLEAQDRLKVANGNVVLATHVLDAVRARKEVGTSSALDEAQQETVLAQQRAAIPPLQQAIGQSRAALAVLIGQTPETTRIGGGSLAHLAAPAVRAGLPAQVLARRPDVALAEARFAAQGFEVEVARKAFLPNLSLSGSTGLASATLPRLLGPEAVAYAFAASLTQPIFEGGALQGQLDEQRGRYRELLEAYRKQILTAFADVESGLIGLRETGEKLRRQGEALSAARKGFLAAQLLLQGGTIDITTLATTENAYFQAQDAEVQARGAHFRAAVALFQALGGGWSRDAQPPVEIKGPI